MEVWLLFLLTFCATLAVEFVVFVVFMNIWLRRETARAVAQYEEENS